MSSEVTIRSVSKNFEMKVTYGFYRHEELGKFLIGIDHEDSICFLTYCRDENEFAALEKLKQSWPNAASSQDDDLIQPFGKKAFCKESPNSLLLTVSGTEMQVEVWKQLTNIKKGCTATYEDIAKAIGRPKAVRAVGNAVGKNMVLYAIPCHRIIHKNGKVNKFSAGVDLKRALLGYEGVKI